MDVWLEFVARAQYGKSFVSSIGYVEAPTSGETTYGPAQITWSFVTGSGLNERESDSSEENQQQTSWRANIRSML